MIDVGSYVTNLVRMYGSRPVAVFGLGMSGISVIKALRNANAEVLAWDDHKESHEEAERAGAILTPLDQETLSECAALILAPGVPLHFPQPHPVVEAARAAGIEIYGDIEVFYRSHPSCKTIGITGTNGKSTTTALIAHILKVCGRDVQVGGNLGTPVLNLETPHKNTILVLELSSFQVDLCPTFRPDIAVLLNVTPDHIERHGTLENYIAVKERIFEGQGTAILGIDDEITQAMQARVQKGERELIPISGEKLVKDGISVSNGILYGRKTELGSLNAMTTLWGTHNHQNAAAAYAACRSCGLEPIEIYEAMKTYPGLPHRQYPVRAINGVTYINDSKATNAESTARALACHKNIYWILGGRKKDGGINGLERYFDKIRHVFLIGESAEEFSARLDKYKMPYEINGTLEAALESAHAMAQSERGQPGGATVLLSPACASYDQFKNFEERGNRFTWLVENLEEAA